MIMNTISSGKTLKRLRYTQVWALHRASKGLARVPGECSGESDTVLRNFSDSLALKNGRRSGSYFLDTARGVQPGKQRIIIVLFGANKRDQ